LFTVRGRKFRISAMSRLDLPRAIHIKTSDSRCVRRSWRSSTRCLLFSRYKELPALGEEQAFSRLSPNLSSVGQSTTCEAEIIFGKNVNCFTLNFLARRYSGYSSCSKGGAA
jgi:hypothetical protein